MKPRYWVRLHDMLTCIAGVREAIQGQTFESFVASWTLQRAVERGIEIISEASKHIPEEVKSRHPAVPWPEVRSIGNHLRHTYERIEPDIIWHIAKQDLDQLEPVLRAMLAEIEGLEGARS